MRIKDIVIIGMLSALLIVIQYTMAFIPNVELVTMLILVFTCTLRKKTLYIISVFVLLEGLLYGFGLWWLNYLYIWFILYLVAMLFHKERSPILWALIAGVYGLSFGALCAIPYFFMGLAKGTLLQGIQTAFAYWVAGIPFDITHGIANFIVTLILFPPISKLLKRLYYGNASELVICGKDR